MDRTLGFPPFLTCGETHSALFPPPLPMVAWPTVEPSEGFISDYTAALSVSHSHLQYRRHHGYPGISTLCCIMHFMEPVSLVNFHKLNINIVSATAISVVILTGNTERGWAAVFSVYVLSPNHKHMDYGSCRVFCIWASSRWNTDSRVCEDICKCEGEDSNLRSSSGKVHAGVWNTQQFLHPHLSLLGRHRPGLSHNRDSLATVWGWGLRGPGVGGAGSACGLSPWCVDTISPVSPRGHPLCTPVASS